MYNRAKSLIGIMKDNFIASYFVYDTINDARVVCENLYLIIKKPELDKLKIEYFYIGIMIIFMNI